MAALSVGGTLFTMIFFLIATLILDKFSKKRVCATCGRPDHEHTARADKTGWRECQATGCPCYEEATRP